MFGNEQLKSFEKTKELLLSKQVLKPLDPTLDTVLFTDACRTGFGYILTNRDKHNRLSLIQCGSKNVSSAQTAWSIVELEFFCVVFAVLKCRFFLLGQKEFEIVVDHKPILSLVTKSLDQFSNPKLRRLREKLFDYNFKVIFLKGKQNEMADALSRQLFFPSSQKENIFDELHIPNVCHKKGFL